MFSIEDIEENLKKTLKFNVYHAENYSQKYAKCSVATVD